MNEIGGKRPERNLSLDMIRGAAALMVLVRHMPHYADIPKSPLENVVAWGQEIGWIGVDLFFVMSGFLISTLIYQEFNTTGNFHATRFLVRRAFKIWPVYFIGYWGVTALRCYVALSRSKPEQAKQLLIDGGWNSVFLQNYVHCERWLHSWTIAIEEHFYTVFAGLAFVAIYFNRKESSEGRQQFRFLVPLFVLVAIIVLGLRVAESNSTYRWSAVYYSTHLRIDSLLFGVLLGYLHQYHQQSIPRWVFFGPVQVMAIVIAGTVPAIWKLETNVLCGTIGFTVLYLCCGVLVLGAMGNPQFGQETPWLRRPCRLLAGVGVYSYTVYLAHSFLPMTPGFEMIRQFTTGLVSRKIGLTTAVWYDRLGFITASVLLGIVLSHLIERPFLKLRSRWCPSHHADLKLKTISNSNPQAGELAAESAVQ